MTAMEAQAYAEALKVYGVEVVQHHLPLVLIVAAVGFIAGCFTHL